MGDSEEEVRSAVRSRIASGELPQSHVTHQVYGGVADGSSDCSCCGASIAAKQIQYEVELCPPDGRSLPMHRRCYQAWRSVRDAQALAAGSIVRVFQVAYTPELLTRRSTLLARHGYQVTSALGNDAAKASLQQPGRRFDVFIIGRAAPEGVRLEMARWIRTHFPDRRIVALHPDDEQRLDGLRYNANDYRPEGWMSAIAAAAQNGMPSNRSSV
jgi:CheY-like chemotaxis protein